jgi:beta-glucosidase
LGESTGPDDPKRQELLDHWEGTKCGPAENINIPVPLIESPEHIKAAEAATREKNAPYLTVMLEGKYTDAYLEAAGNAAPKFTDDDLKIISSPVDFVGINVYRPFAYVLASDQAPGYREVPFNASHLKMFSSWHVLGPEALYWAPKFVQSLWKAKEIHITENACAADKLAEDGNVYDTDRVMFLRNCLTQLQRATADRVPVKGYFLWSMMDNFEWSAGYGNRFGPVRFDGRANQWRVLNGTHREALGKSADNLVRAAGAPLTPRLFGRRGISEPTLRGRWSHRRYDVLMW